MYKSLEQAHKDYMFYLKLNNPEGAGDVAKALTDEMAKALYERLEAENQHLDKDKL